MSNLKTRWLALAMLWVLCACEREAGPGEPATGSDPAGANLPSSAPDVRQAAPTATTQAVTTEAPLTEGNPAPIATPQADTPTPPVAPGARITYTCENGAVVSVTYQVNAAMAQLEDQEPRALVQTNTPTGNGERFEDAMLVVERSGNVITLTERGSAPRRCAETGGNA